MFIVLSSRLLDECQNHRQKWHYRRQLHGGDRRHGQKVVGAMPQSRPHRNFVMSPLYTSKRYSKNDECVIMKVKKVR